MSSPATIPILILPVAASLGVHASGVCYDFDPAFDKVRQNFFNHRDKVARVARTRVASALLLHDRHRYLGEIIESQVVNRSASDLLDGRLK
jgi:hypothetical protein